MALKEMLLDLTSEVQSYKEQLCTQFQPQDKIYGHEIENMVIDGLPGVVDRDSNAVKAEGPADISLEEKIPYEDECK